MGRGADYRASSQRAWYRQLDIHNYFMSIDKEILFRMLADRIMDDDAHWLSRLLVFHDRTRDSVLRGNPNLLKAIAPHKTLFNVPPNFHEALAAPLIMEDD